ncbi:MAG: hypothetical protein ABI281_04985 [Caldimonas sp.]
MLRTLLVALIAANLLFFGFTLGWFDGIAGMNSLGDREPERLVAQVRPETIRLLPVAAPGAATTVSSCFESGPFSAAESSAAEATLKATLPAGSWSDVRTDSPSAAGPVVAHFYRIANADAALAARLPTLRLDPTSRPFGPCKTERPR